MNKDSHFTHIHMHEARLAEHWDDMCKDKLPTDDISVPARHQPINPEDEDDVVPNQHAAFGIARATQNTKESTWKDYGLSELMRKGLAGNSKRGGSVLPR